MAQRCSMFVCFNRKLKNQLLFNQNHTHSQNQIHFVSYMINHSYKTCHTVEQKEQNDQWTSSCSSYTDHWNLLHGALSGNHLVFLPKMCLFICVLLPKVSHLHNKRQAWIAQRHWLFSSVMSFCPVIYSVPSSLTLHTACIIDSEQE